MYSQEVEVHLTPSDGIGEDQRDSAVHRSYPKVDGQVEYRQLCVSVWRCRSVVVQIIFWSCYPTRQVPSKKLLCSEGHSLFLPDDGCSFWYVLAVVRTFAPQAMGSHFSVYYLK